uniref:F-box domain-containing protein n=1 Tax=Acrobeloides nanus TaxID=290746 RepID=A0A914CN47_9BILA
MSNEQILTKSAIPHEILLNIFQFLIRDEVEKSQLVSKSWNEQILTSYKILPLRGLYILDLTKKSNNQQEPEWVKEQIAKHQAGQPTDPTIFRCFAKEQISMYKNTFISLVQGDVYDESFIEKMKEIVENNEEKLNVFRVALDFREESDVQIFESHLKVC